MKSKQFIWLAILLPALFSLEAADAARVIRPVDAPGCCFRLGSRIQFRMSPETPVTVTDWQDKPVFQGKSDSRGLLVLPDIGAGFFRIAAAGMSGKRDFAIVYPKKPGTGAFCQVNTCSAWVTHLTKPADPALPESGPEHCAFLLRLGGFASAREFVSWKEIEPAKGQYCWDRKYRPIFRKFHDSGIKVACCFRDSPRWARNRNGPNEKSPAPNSFPDDLTACYRFAKKLAEQMGSFTAVWEFWNEPDQGGNQDAAWDFAASMKAAWLGFKAGAPRIPVALGSLCLYPVSLQYDKTVLDNDLKYYFDWFNYHTYTELSNYTDLTDQIEQLLKKTGNQGKPLIFTETGTNAEGHAVMDSLHKGKKEHSFAQELLVAEFHPKSVLALKMRGVREVYPFVLLPFNEISGSKAWGLLRHDYTVKPAFAALALMNHLLGGAELAGQLKTPPGITAYLLARGGSQTIAYWLESPLDSGKKENPAVSGSRTFTLAVPAGTYRIYDPFGKETAVKTEKGKLVLTADHFIRYAAGLKDLKAARPAIRRPELPMPRFDGDPTVLLKVRLSPDMILAGSRSAVEFREGIRQTTFQIDVFNCSNELKKGRIQLTCGGQEIAVPQEITLEPWGKAAVPVVMPVPAKNQGRIILGGTFNGKRITRCIIPFFKSAVFKGKLLTRASRPEAWKASTSGKMTISAAKDGAVRFDTEFQEKRNCWTVPTFLLDLPEESLQTVKGMRFDFRLHTPPKNARWPLIYFIGVKSAKARYQFKPHNDWQTVTVLFDPSLQLGKAQAFQLGLSSKGGPLSCSIRNFELLYFDLEKSCSFQPLDRAGTPAAWKTDDTAKLRITSGGDPGEVRFDSGNTGPARPSLPLLLPHESIRNAAGIGFEIKVDSQLFNISSAEVVFQLGETSVSESFKLNSAGWQRVVIPFEKLKYPDLVTAFQISLSGNSAPFSYSIRRLGFYYR
ncbi:MAG: hypothetical protein IKO93_16880 [Lentisphaeria bacterium]|nr:hypothetical protein [Lentisphaeria bacterium]